MNLNSRQLVTFSTGILICFTLIVSSVAANQLTVPASVLQQARLSSTPTSTITPTPPLYRVRLDYIPSPTYTAPPTVTVTPTSMPGPPTLIAPAAGAVLPQPVSPNQWHFTWSARTGPCYSTINIDGPGGRHISAQVDYKPNYQYVYTQTETLPDDALTPWLWSVGVVCNQTDSNHSEIRSFFVAPVLGYNFRTYLPMIMQNR